MTSSILSIIDAASEADLITCCFTLKGSRTFSFRMSFTSPEKTSIPNHGLPARSCFNAIRRERQLGRIPRSQLGSLVQLRVILRRLLWQAVLFRLLSLRIPGVSWLILPRARRLRQRSCRLPGRFLLRTARHEGTCPLRRRHVLFRRV